MATSSEATSDQAPAEDARDELQAAVPEAAATLRELLDAEKETVQIRAAEAILDRAGLTKASSTSTSAAKREIGGASKDDPLDDLL